MKLSSIWSMALQLLYLPEVNWTIHFVDLYSLSMVNFSIKDLEDFSGVRKHTIRIWEKRYRLLQPKRTETMQRSYTAVELNILLETALLNQSGYRISRIARMSENEKCKIVSTYAQKQLRAVHNLIICMAEMDIAQFEMLLDGCIQNWGIHETITGVIVPFLERIGLWQKVESKSYVENILLITPLMEQKLHVGIEQAVSSKPGNKTVLLFLPPGERQQLPLLYLKYQLKLRGYKTLYLSTHIRCEALKAISLYKNPDYIIATLLERGNHSTLVPFVEDMSISLPATKMFTIGNSLSLREGNQLHYTHFDTLEQALSVFTEGKLWI
jgi:MerR family transcriptional regulator, light-induced transcriptional regulator